MIRSIFIKSAFLNGILSIGICDSKLEISVQLGRNLKSQIKTLEQHLDLITVNS